MAHHRGRSTRLTDIWILIFGLSLFASPGSATQRRSIRKSAPTPPAAAPQEPIVPGPLLPMTLEQEPSSAPQVIYQAQQLTIVARNSTLGDVLRAVRLQTGAIVDVSGNAGERVVGQFGPGPARDVVAALLNGSHYNYVLLGSVQNPNILEHVILTPRPAGSESSAPAQTPAAEGATVGPPGIAQIGQPAEELQGFGDNSDDAMPEITPEDDQANAQSDDAPQVPQPPGGMRSPQQMLQDLQQRQQQMQQGNVIQPQQGAPNPGTPGTPIMQQQ